MSTLQFSGSTTTSLIHWPIRKLRFPRTNLLLFVFYSATLLEAKPLSPYELFRQEQELKRKQKEEESARIRDLSIDSTLTNTSDPILNNNNNNNNNGNENATVDIYSSENTLPPTNIATDVSEDEKESNAIPETAESLLLSPNSTADLIRNIDIRSSTEKAKGNSNSRNHSLRMNDWLKSQSLFSFLLF